MKTIINNIECGKCVTISAIKGDRKTTGRLASMGIYPGCQIQVLSCCPNAGCVLRVCDGTISLEGGLMNCIEVV